MNELEELVSIIDSCINKNKKHKEVKIKKSNGVLTSYIKRKGYTLNEFAKMINVSGNTISSWNNKKSYPTIDKLMDMSKVLNCKVSTLCNLWN